MPIGMGKLGKLGKYGQVFLLAHPGYPSFLIFDVMAANPTPRNV